MTKKFSFSTCEKRLSVHFPRFEEGDKFYERSLSFDPISREIKKIDPKAWVMCGHSYYGYLVDLTKAQQVKDCIRKHLAEQNALELLD